MEENKFRKIINFGKLPNKDTKTVETGLKFDNNCVLFKMQGMATYENNKDTYIFLFCIEDWPIKIDTDYIVFLGKEMRRLILNIDNNGKLTITTSNNESNLIANIFLEYLKAE